MLTRTPDVYIVITDAEALPTGVLFTPASRVPPGLIDGDAGRDPRPPSAGRRREAPLPVGVRGGQALVHDDGALGRVSRSFGIGGVRGTPVDPVVEPSGSAQRHRPHLCSRSSHVAGEGPSDLTGSEHDVQSVLTVGPHQVSHGWRRTMVVFVHQRPSPRVLPAPTTARPSRTMA